MDSQESTKSTTTNTTSSSTFAVKHDLTSKDYTCCSSTTKTGTATEDGCMSLERTVLLKDTVTPETGGMMKSYYSHPVICSEFLRLPNEKRYSSPMFLVVKGEPIPKARHRVFYRGGHIRSYDPQHEAKLYVKGALMEQVQRYRDSDNPVIRSIAGHTGRGSAFRVELCFHTTPPMNWSQRRRGLALMGLELPAKKPDIDNLEKWILDCMNGVAIVDDRLIVEIQSKKVYSLKPRTEIKIAEIIPMTLNEKQKKIATKIKIEELQEIIDSSKKIDDAIKTKNPVQLTEGLTELSTFHKQLKYIGNLCD